MVWKPQNGVPSFSTLAPEIEEEEEEEVEREADDYEVPSPKTNLVNVNLKIISKWM